MIESILMSVESASRLALEALLNGLWQGVALTLALWLLLRAIPRMTPSARYLIWSATLAAVIALPFVSAERRASLAQAGANSPVFAENPITQSAAQNSEGVAGEASPPSGGGVLGAAIRLSAPGLAVSDNTSAAKPLGLGSLTRSDRDKSDQESGAQDKGAQDNGAQGDQGAKSRDGVRSADVADISRGVEIESADLADSPFSAATLTRSPPGSATLSLTLPGALALTLLAIWFVVSSALLARLWISFYSLRRMVSHSEPLPPDLRERCLWLAGKSRLRRKTRFLRSAEVTMPLAIGLFRPAIVFPGSLIDRLSQTEFDQVTLHELAHLKRFDDWSVLIQRVAQALFFFHPSVLWISRRLDGERELACDDTVVHQTGVTVGYAACLTHVAQLTIEPPRTALAAGAFLTRKRLFTRVERIIENRLYLSAASSRVAVAGALLLLLAALAQFALTPSVVAIDRPSVRAETSEGGLIGRSGDEREDPRLISKILPAVYVGPQATGSEILYAPSVDAGVVTVLPESPVAVAAVSSEGSASLEKTYDKLIKEFNVQRRRLERKMRNRNPNDNAFAGLSRKMRAAEKRYREIYESALAQRSSTRIESARKQIERELRRLRQGAGYLGGVSIGPGGAKGYVLSAPTADAPHVYVAPGSLKSVAPRVRARLDAIAVPGVAAPVIAFDDDGGGIYGYSAPDGATTILYEPVRASTRSGTETTITSDGGFVIRSVDDEISYKWTDRGHRLDMRARGRIEFAEDDSDVSGLSDDGYLIIRERHRGDDREYEVSADGSGGLERVYYEDGRRAEIDDNAREWIGEMLARAIRNTGIGAEKRVGRILKSGGVDAVLDEIGLIESDHAMSIYYRALMGKSEMDVKQRIRLLDHLSKELDSDYQRAEVLSEIDETWLENKEIRLAYVASVGRIDSDYEKRRALSPVISRTDLSPELRLSLLNIAREIDSDYERAELLGEIARSGLDESEVLDAYVIAIEDIDSDYEKRRVLAFITDRRDLSKETALAVLKMAQSISSDYERAELLLEMYRYSRDNDTLMQAYVDAIVDIDSDYEKRRVLDELTSNRKLNDDLALTVLGIAGSIDSDYERAELLTHMARFCTGNPKLIEVYLDALADLESDYETRRVLEQLDLGEKTDPGLLIRVLSVVQRIESNYDKAQILEGLAPICLDSNELYEAFLDAVDSITSDYERNQLLSIIYDRDRRLRKGSK